MTPKIKFTKAALLAVTVPPGETRVEVFDSELKELGCRVSIFGTFTMFLRKKVAGRPVKKTLGRYTPGPGGQTVEDFRTKARGELGRISDNPEKWIEGETAIEAHEITIRGAFDFALAASKRGSMARRDWDDSRDRFTEWMRANYPHIGPWAKIRRQHIREYMEAQKPTRENLARGISSLSPTRLRLLMQPISQTARYMWLEYEIPNVAERLGVSSRLIKTPAPVYLEDILGFLDNLKERQLATLEAGAALAGLGGLQLLEVLRLTWGQGGLPPWSCGSLGRGQESISLSSCPASQSVHGGPLRGLIFPDRRGLTKK